MDTIEAIMTAVWYELTEDAEMIDICGGEVRLTPVWAQPDSPFPYLVYRVTSTVQEPWAVANGVLTLDVWDYGQTFNRTMELRSRIIALLDRRRFDVEEAGVVRISLNFDQSITEETQYIWRRTMDFGLRFTRNKDIGAIVSREEAG